MANDIINHPDHYTAGGIEVIDFIEAKRLNYHRGNAVKYIARAGKKAPEKEVEDLRKAAWYLNREIDRITPEEAKEAQKAEQRDELIAIIREALPNVAEDDVDAGLKLIADILLDKGVRLTRRA